MRQLRRWPALVGGVIPCVGLFWAAPVEAQAPAQIRDSAGIRIVENPPLRAGTPPLLRVSAEPTLIIGREDLGPEFRFNVIVSVIQIADGSIVIADQGSSELRTFSATGQFRSKRGRPGQGPGDFQRLADVVEVAPGVLRAWDALNLRFTVFGPGPNAVRTFRADVPGGRGGPMTGLIRGLLTGGSFWGYRVGRAAIPSAPTVVRDTLIVSQFGADGRFLRPVGRFLGFQRLLDAGGSMPGPDGVVRAAFSVSGVPFPVETIFRTSADWLYAGDGEGRYQILAYDTSGRLARILRVEEPPVRVTPALIAAHRAVDWGPGTPARPMPSPSVDARYFPATLPAFAALRVDAHQRLWVQDYPRPGDPTRRWRVFDSDGRLLGWVATPPGLEIFEIGRDYLLGVWRDDDGIEYVRMYRYQPAGRS